MKFPEKYRAAGFENGSGIFVIKDKEARLAYFMVASSSGGWDHVSVIVKICNRKGHVTGEAKRCPRWDEMCVMKGLFWDPEDTVIQIHPPKTEYVSTHPYCLHLWAPNDGREIPRPDPLMVGFPGSDIQKL